MGTIAFSPDPVPISVNQVVQWNNATGTAHTVTSTTVPANGTFNASLNDGTSVCLKFTAAGAFNYFCSIHPAMTGVVNRDLTPNLLCHRMTSTFTQSEVCPGPTLCLSFPPFFMTI